MAKVEGVFANLNPIRISTTRDFGSAFTAALSASTQVRMCTGYVAAESLVELRQLVETFFEIEKFELIVGMAKFDGLTRDQLKGLDKLDQTLRESKRGGVYVATALPIHAKVSSFVGAIQQVLLGSSNLGSLTRATRQYEIDLLVENDSALFDQVDEFLLRAISASVSFQEVREHIKIIATDPHPLANLEGVELHDASSGEPQFDENLQFEIPVGVGEKSNLNTFFGKGRKAVNGRVVPRPWYEVELIVPKRVTELPGYPTKEVNEGEFTVITDDGFEFQCRTSGDYSKNLRSKSDLETLGRWLKGRLERAGALEMGEMVTEETLKKYGRDFISLKKIDGSQKWFLDFGVESD